MILKEGWIVYNSERKQLKYSINNKVKTESPILKPLFSEKKLSQLFRYYRRLLAPLPEISFWKALILGNKLPSLYRPYIRLLVPFKTYFKKWVAWSPSKRSVQLELTSFCNLSCPNCNRSIGHAPNKEYMSLQQIEKFVNESIELNWEWQLIYLIGGEPTLHPQFFEVLDIIKRYKDINPNCFIEVWTNGYGTKVNEILSKLPPWVRVKNSAKNPKKDLKFNSYNIAPVDLKNYKYANFTKGCWVTEICGIGLSQHGYYPCGSGAAVDRVFGFDIGIKKLSEVNNSTLRNQMNLLCRYCGHFKESPPIVEEEKISVSWIKAYENYKKRKPEMSLY